MEREAAYEFTEKPVVKMAGEDRYKISFAVKGHCDVTVGIVDEQNLVVRHLASGVLGSNAPAPFQKNSLRQTLVWNGKDHLDWYPKSPERLKARVMLGLKPARVLFGNAAIPPLEPPPNRPGDLAAVWGDPGRSAWAEGMEWLYPGASPIVPHYAFDRLRGASLKAPGLEA